MSDFPKNLRRYRKRKKYTQVELAEKLNYGYTAIANYESGRNEPRFDDLLRLAELLDVTVNDLLGMPPLEKEERYLELFHGLEEEKQKLILQLMEALERR